MDSVSLIKIDANILNKILATEFNNTLKGLYTMTTGIDAWNARMVQNRKINVIHCIHHTITIDTEKKYDKFNTISR